MEFRRKILGFQQMIIQRDIVWNFQEKHRNYHGELFGVFQGYQLGNFTKFPRKTYWNVDLTFSKFQLEIFLNSLNSRFSQL